MDYSVIELTGELLPDIININRLTCASSWSAEQFNDELKIENGIRLGIIEMQTNSLSAFLFTRLITIKSFSKSISIVQLHFELEIFLIATHPLHQKRGLGRKLLDTCLKKLEINTEVFLEVRKSNQSAISFYSKNGFVELGERPHYYQDPIDDAILMKFIISR